MRIGVVAPSCRITPDLARRVSDVCHGLYAGRAELGFHPQCFLSEGHFAGPDAARADAFVEVANDPAIDALWFGRGGYGAYRIVDSVLPRLGPAARRKLYLGYSDAGAMLGALYAAGIGRLAHGPMPGDLNRPGGDAAVRRALGFLVDGAAAALEPAVLKGESTAAFNITILSHLIGTPHLPDLSGHVLMLEEVSEAMYRIDRALGQITTSLRGLRGLMLGRCSAITANDPDFGQDEAQVTRAWCARTGIPYLGRADIGHDVDNKVVPFGRWRSESA